MSNVNSQSNKNINMLLSFFLKKGEYNVHVFWKSFSENQQAYATNFFMWNAQIFPNCCSEKHQNTAASFLFFQLPIQSNLVKTWVTREVINITYIKIINKTNIVNLNSISYYQSSNDVT